MAATSSVVLYDPQDTSPEVRTLAGFLSGNSGRTRGACTLDLRMFYRWCDERRLGLFEVTRTHIELYARELEDLGRKPATIGRRTGSTTCRTRNLLAATGTTGRSSRPADPPRAARADARGCHGHRSTIRTGERPARPGNRAPLLAGSRAA